MKKLIVKFAILFAIIVAYFVFYEMQANRIAKEAGIHRMYANALKHAKAARDLYQLLDTLYLPAEPIVVWLGDLNEHVEQVTRFRHRDSTLEMMKDLYNNYAGITTAKWLKDNPDNPCEEDPIVMLTREKILILDLQYVPVLDEEQVEMRSTRHVDEAIAWAQARQEAIASQVLTRLDKCVASHRKSLIEE